MVYDLCVFRRIVAPTWLTSGLVGCECHGLNFFVFLIILTKMVPVLRVSKVQCKRKKSERVRRLYLGLLFPGVKGRRERQQRHGHWKLPGEFRGAQRSPGQVAAEATRARSAPTAQQSAARRAGLRGLMRTVIRD